ncbi:hypothetical protein PLEOSDRAFT_1049836 [Pleurotus ostreatus PC15]|uniref:DUF6593 domain-containing protein n=1 Tax=Pleurotus ostreatus (strain PC15) TaxID=1137138 RepID=A0A067N7Y8_PLEO1|nr:hypothetical protein PLEOSDRAFT_1049836 [Pleurotus ostreatus PC15]
MGSYGLSYFLEDMTGKLTGSEFVDIYGRMRLTLRRTTFDTTRAAYMIFNTTSSAGYSPHSTTQPLVALDFGPKNALGTISFPPNVCLPMQKYLIQTSSGSSKSRRFRASDGQDYCWAYRGQIDQEWACTNANGYVVAYYSLKPHGEPEYAGSSGCSLTIEEPYPHIAPELLASLLIMRHIAAHNL